MIGPIYKSTVSNFTNTFGVISSIGGAVPGSPISGTNH